jgi:hypothetical protein
MITSEGSFGKQVGVRLLFPEHTYSHLSVLDEARSTRAATDAVISYNTLAKRVPKGGQARACSLLFVRVLHMLLSLFCCLPEFVIVYCCPSALLSI